MFSPQIDTKPHYAPSLPLYPANGIRQGQKLHKAYNENMAMAGVNVPWNAHYQYYARTGRFTRSSWQRWQKRSNKCIKFLLKAENALSKAAEIAEKIPAVAGNPEWIRRQKDSIKAMRTQITQERRKRGP